MADYDNSPIKIMQWNMRSFRANRSNLISLLREHDPEVVLLNETWMKQVDVAYIKNYN